jgi:DNA-binding GntR family transcriptional regulator
MSTTNGDRNRPLGLRVYEELRDQISTGVLRPNDALLENEIAGRLGVSRTPVREAIQRLVQDGFAHMVQKRGAFVSSITISDVLEILVIREALEGISSSLAATRLGDETLEGLQRDFRELEEKRRQGPLDYAGDHLHTAILEAANNRRIVRTLGLFKHQLAWFQVNAVSLPGRIDKSFEEHQVILNALLARDPARAEAAMRQHIISTRRDVERRYVLTFTEAFPT